MVAQERHLGCPPNKNDVCVCGKICCGKTKYIQPMPPKSFKPEPEYRKPTVPMDSNTVYKNSFFGPVAEDVKICRMKPYLPVNSLHSSNSKIEEHSITKLSFPVYTQTCKRDPILPHKRSMLGKGSMQDYTTQRHDYVAKPQCKRNAIIRQTSIKTNDVPLDSDTVQKLSFVHPDTKSLSVAKSFKPFYLYKRPDVPMEEVTTHKLSYMPVTLQIKEELPWAKRVAIQASDMPFEQGTTYKLSYIPNCGAQKLKPLRTKDNQGLVTAAKCFDDHTIYKDSFYVPGGCFKRSPILPTLQLHKSDDKMNPNSVYSLSYPGHLHVPKSGPILPHKRFLLGSGPLDDLTTQRRDFVDKPLCRRSPIIPICQMEKTDAPIENQTTMKLSYMQQDGLSRSTPIRPKDGITQANGPMDSKTIHKLSFRTVTVPVKEEYPWMRRKTHTIEVPMDFVTTQNLSFMPPGVLIKTEGECSCSYPGECLSDGYPKADSY